MPKKVSRVDQTLSNSIMFDENKMPRAKLARAVPQDFRSNCIRQIIAVWIYLYHEIVFALFINTLQPSTHQFVCGLKHRIPCASGRYRRRSSRYRHRGCPAAQSDREIVRRDPGGGVSVLTGCLSSGPPWVQRLRQSWCPPLRQTTQNRRQ